MTLTPRNAGWIEVICGSMFSGKTEELIRRLRRAQIAQMPTIIFKPRIDSRYSETHIVSHNRMKLESHLVNTPQEILHLAENASVVAIDEAQFFNDSIEADYLDKLRAICVQCGNPATYTQRTSNDAGQVVIGELDKYEARCRNCYQSPEDE